MTARPAAIRAAPIRRTSATDRRQAAPSRSGLNALSILIGAGLLTWPALYNHYPILFSDTGGLLEMGLAPSMGWDKPFVYGPLAALLSLRLTLWLPLAAQGALVSWMLWLTASVLTPPRAVLHALLCATLAAGSAAPWVTATLLPDFLAPVTALGLFILGFGQLRPARFALVWALTATAIAAHLSHLVLAFACLLATAMLQRAVPWRGASSLAAALLFLLVSNWVGHGQFAVSPHGAVFALARLVADGPARDYLDRVCPEAGYRLCAWRGRLPADSDQFLWDPNGPFWTDPAPVADSAAEAARIVRGTVATYPLRVLRDALVNGARQLGHFEVGDTLGPDHLDEAVRPRLAVSFPAVELRRYKQSAQVQGRLTAASLVPLHAALLALGAAGCLVLLIRGLLRPSLGADFAAFVLIAVATNALATGALSSVQDRYQARIAWLVLLPPLVSYAARLATSSGDIRTSAS